MSEGGRHCTIDSGSGEVILATCQMRLCNPPPDERAAHYYSAKHAADAGWLFTFDVKYCKPDSDHPAGICPQCAKQKWKD